MKLQKTWKQIDVHLHCLGSEIVYFVWRWFEAMQRTFWGKIKVLNTMKRDPPNPGASRIFLAQRVMVAIKKRSGTLWYGSSLSNKLSTQDDVFHSKNKCQWRTGLHESQTKNFGQNFKIWNGDTRTGQTFASYQCSPVLLGWSHWKRVLARICFSTFYTNQWIGKTLIYLHLEYPYCFHRAKIDKVVLLNTR